LSNDQ
jgi:hypothetical protein